MPRQSGNFVHFFVKRHTFLKVFELDGAADFSQYGEGVRIPLDHNLAELDLIAFVNFDLGAVHDRIAFAFAALFVDHRNRALAIHDNQIARISL